MSISGLVQQRVPVPIRDVVHIGIVGRLKEEALLCELHGEALFNTLLKIILLP